MKIHIKLMSVLLGISLCSCSIPDKTGSNNYNVYYDQFALRSTVRPNPPTDQKRFINAVRKKHFLIKHIVKKSTELDDIFIKIKGKGCDLGQIRDSIAVLIVNNNILEAPLLIYKEGPIAYNGNLCPITKKESDNLLKSLDLNAYWLK